MGVEIVVESTGPFLLPLLSAAGPPRLRADNSSSRPLDLGRCCEPPSATLGASDRSSARLAVRPSLTDAGPARIAVLTGRAAGFGARAGRGKLDRLRGSGTGLRPRG